MLLPMTSDHDELYQAVIQDHFERPRHHGLLIEPTHAGAAHNPFCGDTVRISLRIRDLRVEQVGFEGRGCSISQAAASMLSSLAVERTAAEVRALADRFASELRSRGGEIPAQFGDLRALVGVRRFPNRIRCALLAFEAVLEALAGTEEE